MLRTEKQWIDIFQWFHRHPELGNQEFETTKKICEVLREEGIEVLPSGLKTGAVAVIRGEFPGRTVCLRADIDALPVEEATDLPYRSETKGRMHACGHDFHITTALYAATLLQQHREQIHGTVYLVFQPAEEVIDGAHNVIATNLLGEVEEFYGFHAEPSLSAGQISIENGSVMAAVDQFAIMIYGKGCHGAAPHLGNNPVPVMASVISEIQSFATRQTNPLQPKVVSITHAEAGQTWNVIPDKAFIEGTARSMDAQEREKIKQNILGIVKAHETMAGVSTEVVWHAGPPAVINDAKLVETARKVCTKQGLERISLSPAMLGDDFSEYKVSVKGSAGLYVKIGTGVGPSLHSPLFTVDTSAMKGAAEFCARLLLERTGE